MRLKMRGNHAVWWVVVQRAWHQRTARRFYRTAEAYGRQAFNLLNRTAHHEQRAKHFQLQEIRRRDRS